MLSKINLVVLFWLSPSVFFEIDFDSDPDLDCSLFFVPGHHFAVLRCPVDGKEISHIVPLPGGQLSQTVLGQA